MRSATSLSLTRAVAALMFGCIAGANSGLVSPSFSAARTSFAPGERPTCASTILRPMSTRRPYCTPSNGPSQQGCRRLKRIQNEPGQ